MDLAPQLPCWLISTFLDFPSPRVPSRLDLAPLLLPLGLGLVHGWPGICMITEECNPHLIFTVVDSLRREVDLLTQRVDTLEHSSGGATGRWELLSLGHYPLVRYPNPGRLLQVEDGPPEVTQDLLALAATLPLAEDVAIQRVIRAFDAGFWARAAIETQTPYWGTHLVPEADEVFFVYRVIPRVARQSLWLPRASHPSSRSRSSVLVEISRSPTRTNGEICHRVRLPRRPRNFCYPHRLARGRPNPLCSKWHPFGRSPHWSHEQ